MKLEANFEGFSIIPAAWQAISGCIGLVPNTEARISLELKRTIGMAL